MICIFLEEVEYMSKFVNYGVEVFEGVVIGSWMKRSILIENKEI